jgi:outer membrane protein assembly factor BamB
VKRCILGLSLLAGCLLVPSARADNWPSWRGPTQDGVSKETNIPTEWGETKNLAWKLPLPGRGASTPVIWGDRIFLTSMDGQDVVLLCASTAGKELWKRKLGTGSRMYMRDEGDNASPTPTTDGKHVWVLAGTGDFACFDVDGKEVWRCNLQQRYGPYRVQHGGIHITPVLDGDRLYLALLSAGGHWVIALDKATGAEVWKAERKSDARAECIHSYASPVVWRNGKDAYLVTHGNDYAVAHRLGDGAEIWRVGDLNPKDHYNFTLRFVTSPVATPELIVVPSAKGGPVVGVKPDARGFIQAGSPQEQWRRPKGTPDVPSPLVHDGLVYLCGERGVLTCLDAKTGAELYSQRIHDARYRASPVYADGKVYLTARDGFVTVVKAGPKFEMLAVNKLPDQTSASPAVADGRIYLHGFKALYAIGPAAK